MSAPPQPASTHAAATATLAHAAQLVGRALARVALERLMLRLAHIAVTGRLR